VGMGMKDAAKNPASKRGNILSRKRLSDCETLGIGAGESYRRAISPGKNKDTETKWVLPPASWTSHAKNMMRRTMPTDQPAAAT